MQTKPPGQRRIESKNEPRPGPKCEVGAIVVKVVSDKHLTHSSNMITVNAPLVYVVDHGGTLSDYAQRDLVDSYTDPVFCHLDNGADLLIRLTHCLDGRLPDLILMATNNPILNGYETLQLLKKDNNFRYIPVLMLVNSSQEKAERRCFELGCNGLIRKPGNYRKMVNAARMLSFAN
jgi:CheY-like chemotaxis protein